MNRLKLNNYALGLLVFASTLAIGLGILLVTASPAYACPADGGGGGFGGFWDWIRNLR